MITTNKLQYTEIFFINSFSKVSTFIRFESWSISNCLMTIWEENFDIKKYKYIIKHRKISPHTLGDIFRLKNNLKYTTSYKDIFWKQTWIRTLGT